MDHDHSCKMLLTSHKDDANNGTAPFLIITMTCTPSHKATTNWCLHFVKRMSMETDQTTGRPLHALPIMSPLCTVVSMWFRSSFFRQGMSYPWPYRSIYIKVFRWHHKTLDSNRDMLWWLILCVYLFLARTNFVLCCVVGQNGLVAL